MDDILNIIGLLALISFSKKRNSLVVAGVASLACIVNIAFYDVVSVPDVVFALVYACVLVVSMATAYANGE